MRGFVSGAAERNAEPGSILAPVTALNSYIYLCCGGLLSVSCGNSYLRFHRLIAVVNVRAQRPTRWGRSTRAKG